MVGCPFLYARERPNKIWCSIPFHFFFLWLAIQQHFWKSWRENLSFPQTSTIFQNSRVIRPSGFISLLTWLKKFGYLSKKFLKRTISADSNFNWFMMALILLKKLRSICFTYSSLRLDWYLISFFLNQSEWCYSQHNIFRWY